MIVFLCISFAGVISAEEPAGFVYDARGGRDPFIPLITKKTRFATGLENIQSIDDIALEGIVWDPGGDSIAILNGIILREGEVVGDVKIKSIDRKSVSLFVNKVAHKINFVKEGEEAGEKE